MLDRHDRWIASRPMYIPPGFTTVFPYIFASDARAYLDFLANGLGGEIVGVHESPDGIVRNAHVRFGDTTIMVSEAIDGRAPSRGTHYLYVADADAAMARATAAGGVQIGDVTDMPYGDRQGGLRDPSGNIWWISQRLAPGPY
jgi:PhnB protein